jgi:hypothetical protein
MPVCRISNSIEVFHAKMDNGTLLSDGVYNSRMTKQTGWFQPAMEYP